MSAGLQIFYKDGTLQFDLTGKYPKFIGQVSTGLFSGQFKSSLLSQGRPFAYSLPDPVSLAPSKFALYAQVEIVGEIIKWEFIPFSTALNQSQNASSTIIYGVY
ncbi:MULTISPECIES: hypothetical protein [unclassified Pseudomonas]|uniref:hypothetical protein n=1 Tax=unclassified Pseudomonas TaxID=196821 RepID=UPI0011799A83|nr:MULTISPECIES: hypothetical protein [unclassified Pseudomonas]